MKKIYTVILLLTLCIAKTNNIKAQVDVQDSLALVDLYNSTNGAHWFHNDNWLTSKPLETWYGIILKYRSVAQVFLYSNNLSGALPSSIGNIHNLKVLFLNNNYLTGNLPSSLGNLHKIKNLSLDYNLLSGSIPTELGDLKFLLSLSLSDNNLSGSIPPELGNLIRLNYLSLSNNQLSGNIPPELGELTYLYALYLDNNQLSRNIPSELSQLSYLSELYLNQNELTGNVPTAFGRLKYLKLLSLEHNNLDGVIPASFSNLTKLKRLNIADNELRGALPSFFTGFSWLNIKHNHFTFDGMEALVQHNFYEFVYNYERKINIHQNGNILSINAGGTLSNNTYKWFNGAALAATINGDSSFTPSASGDYSVSVTNSICTELTLYSDTVSISAADKKFYSNASVNKLSTAFFVSPNPAKNILYLHINADANSAVINIYDLNGKKLITLKTSLQKQNNISINIAALVAGNYFIEVIADDKIMKQKFIKE